MAKSKDPLIRGGQTTQHWVRMAAQVVKGALMFGAFCYAVTFISLSATYYELRYLHVTWAHYMATFAVEHRGNPERLIRYKDPKRGWISRTAESIYLDPFMSKVAADYHDKADQFWAWSFLPGAIGFFVVGGIFYRSGMRLQGDEHIRGTKLVTAAELKKWSQQKWRLYEKQFGKGFKKGPRYTMAGIPFPPNTVEAQTVICGTVGVGKSNAIKELLATIRAEDGKAIIYDRMGAFVRDFYDPTRDIIINPFDLRSKAWSPFFEAENKEFFTQVAEVLIPDRQGSGDVFWSQAARIVFDYAAQTLFERGEHTNRALRDAILQIPAEELARLIEATPGRHFFNEEILKTAGSIRANLIAELRFLEFLRDDGEPFSIRQWVKSEARGFVFLTGDAEHAAATRNVISTVLEVGANALMTCEESHDPRVWFMMDEVPTLNRLPFLPKSLAEIRQFGGAFVLGYQVYSQLEDIYGDKAAQTILGNLNNRIVFNTPDANTAELFSKALGSEDVEEIRESITVGAHETRDGVGFSSQRTERRIVTASQIQALPQFECYLRFGYDAPAAFVRFPPVKVQSAHSPKFVPYRGSGLAAGAMERHAAEDLVSAGKEVKSLPFRLLTGARKAEQYGAWRDRIVKSGLTLDKAREHLDWAYFAHQRDLGREGPDIGPPPLVFGPMLDGTGYVFPEGFDPGTLPQAGDETPNPMAAAPGSKDVAAIVSATTTPNTEELSAPLAGTDEGLPRRRLSYRKPSESRNVGAITHRRTSFDLGGDLS